MQISTKPAEGINCRLCAQAIEGEMLLERLSLQEERIAFPVVVGLKCQTCSAFLCKACYLDANSKLKGLKKLSGMGIDCPECGFPFYSPRGANLGVYPPEVDLSKLEEFDNLLRDLRHQGLGSLAVPLENGLMRIKEHEEHLALHIKAMSKSRDKNGEVEQAFLVTLVALGRAGADWLLREDVLSDDVVEHILELSRANPKKQYEATSALIEIEIARKDGLLIPVIIKAEESFPAYSWAMRRITWDERIVDCFIEELEGTWEVVDMNKSKWHVQAFSPGPAQHVAQVLLALGNERGIRATIQRVLTEMQSRQGTMYGYDVVMDWCMEHGSTIVPFLAEWLKDENPRFRYFSLEFLARIGNSHLDTILTALESDPDEDVRELANSIAKRRRATENGNPH